MQVQTKDGLFVGLVVEPEKKPEKQVITKKPPVKRK